MTHLRPLVLAAFAATASLLAQDSKPFTLQQALSAPYATDLTAAPTGNLFAWVEDAEGRHNLYVGGKNVAATQLTHNTEDDAQDISQLAWSPDAKYIAYTYGAPNGADGKPANPAHLQRPTPVLVMLVSTTGREQPITVAGGRSPLFSRDGHSLFFIRDGQIWTTCLELCNSAQPAEKSGLPYPVQLASHQLVFDRGAASSLTLSPDGNTVAFISRRREANEPSHSFLALFDLATHTLTFPAPSTSNDSAPAFSPDGKQLAWIRTPFTDIPEFANPRTSATPWSIQLIDLSNSRSAPTTDVSSRPKRSAVERPASTLATASRTIYSSTPNAPGSALPDPGGHDPYLLWTADHRIVFYSTADERMHLYAISLAPNSKPTLLTPGEYDAEGASVDNAHRMLTWASNDATSGSADSDRLHIWQLNLTDPGEAPKRRTGGEGIETHPVISHDARSTLASDAHFPSHPALISTDGKLIALNGASQPTTYPAAAFVTPQQILFDSSDGIHLHSQLFLPKNLDSKTKHPAILFFHGGPMRQMLLGYPAMGYYSNAYAMNQYLTSRGFIVLSVNYRCGIGYGLAFHQCESEGATGAAEYNDVLAAQKYLASRPDVDTKRIGVWGGSYGGYLTALALARNSDLFAAGVDFHGVHDWNLEDNASDWKRGSFAQQDAIAAKALTSSPLADLSKWHSPILLIHGDNDGNVAYAQTPLLADALRARNASLPQDKQVDVEELVFPDEIHEFVLHSTWIKAYTAAAEFFERTLKPQLP
jgi:dipeptidyl aminopeptidase/acylaminoacyl peptidase